ncbi:MAG: hypothetical protein AAFV53_16080 [Myxococcota bacterium]
MTHNPPHLGPVALYALSLGGPCPLLAGYSKVDGEMIWLSVADRYQRALRGEESWLRSGYRIQIRRAGRIVAVVYPPRLRTTAGMPRK